MEKYKEQIEKKAAEFAYTFGKGIYNDGLYSGFISGVNSKISERIKVDFAISVLEEIKIPLLEDWDSFAVKRIENKITELKNSINGK